MEDNRKQQLCRFSAGEVIIREGDNDTDLYRIISGKAELYIDHGTEKEILLGIIKENACFGEFGLLLKAPAIYTVVAYSDILAMKITEGAMGDFIRENHQYVMSIMQNMARFMVNMKYHIDMLVDDLEHCGEGERKEVHDAKRILRSYAIYHPDVEVSGYGMGFSGLDNGPVKTEKKETERQRSEMIKKYIR
ncbi:MAG: cyclic nucleotide-binding domain-containing protein [Lachnospiraceae bacterium]|nr:cyclic nucleotide-binding domain-containing protein [Lachnospiraceae bacterium]